MYHRFTYAPIRSSYSFPETKNAPFFINRNNRVFLSHIGFVVVDALNPALIAETTWTKGVSRFFLGNMAFIFFFEVEYAQKYMARLGATPIRFGPSPFHRPNTPS